MLEVQRGLPPLFWAFGLPCETVHQEGKLPGTLEILDVANLENGILQTCRDHAEVVSIKSGELQQRHGSVPGNPRHVSAAGLELFLKLLEATVEMVDAVDGRLALGCQRADDQRNRGA